MYNLKALKARLTRAQNSADPFAVIDATNAAARAFNADGYPDCWHRWNIARQDALWALHDRALCGDAAAQAVVSSTNPFN